MIISFDWDIFPYIRFVRREEAGEFFFKEATDEEKRLVKLSAAELAKEYHEAQELDPSRCVLIEHYLNLRLLRVQIRSSYNVAILSPVIAAILGVAVGACLRGFT